MPRRRSASTDGAKAVRPVGEADGSSSAEQIAFADSSLHELFNQQIMQMLDRTDLGEEQKQAILIGMSCPCCGGAAMSYTVKLKR